MTRHLALIGCTASGKSSLALQIAQACGDVELVSLDSMQVYRGMDIGTAKPAPADQRSVTHHLVDVADPAEEWSVRETQRAARTAIAEIETRGRRALLVGGTGLYVRAVVDRLDVPARDHDARVALEQATATPDGLARAFARLRELDPRAAGRIEPNNRRRIVRALEVIDTTGRPFSSFGPGLTEYGPPAIDVTMIGIWLPRTELRHRVARRFAQMRAVGLIDEVRGLAARPGALSRTAAQAIGYKELLAYLRGDIATPDAAFDLAVTRTQQFARRQRVWFRRDPRIRWVGAARNPEALAPLVLALWQAPAAVPAAQPAS